MKRRKFYYTFKIIIIPVLVLFFSSWQLPVPKHQLELEVIGINEIKGELGIGLYTNKEGWLKKGHEFILERVPVTANNEVIIYKGIPQGTYGISIYHDANNNGKVEKNLIGFPQEGYGFSNNLRPRFKAPAFKHAAFEVKSDTTIQIKLRY